MSKAGVSATHGLSYDICGNERLRVWFRFLDKLCLIGICPLVFQQPVVVYGFILTARPCRLLPKGRKNITQAPTITMLIIVLHHFLKILFCLHSLKFKRKPLDLVAYSSLRVLRKVPLYIDITLRSYSGLRLN